MPLGLDQSLNLSDLFGKSGQNAVSRGGHQDVVFDPDADLFLRNIDSRLDGYNHIRLERTRCRSDIVYFQTNVVTRAMNEILLVALRADVLRRGLMDFADSNSRFDL